MACPHLTPMRPELEPLPPRLATLPVDARGYPVPWFVGWVNGQPEFRCADADKWYRAVRDKLCWMCGGQLGRWQTFVIGPMCAVNRTTAEPPCHTDCAEYAARNCPFLTRPQMVRREDEAINADVIAAEGAGMPLLRNPGVTLLWTTQGYRVFRASKGLLIEIGPPREVAWYACGRAATRAEVIASVESGLPSLRALADFQGPDALAALDQAVHACARLYPEA